MKNFYMIDKDQYKDLCEEHGALVLKVGAIQNKLEKIIENIFLESIGKYLVFKTHVKSWETAAIRKFKIEDHFDPEKEYLYIGKITYIENLPDGYDSSGYPDTILIEGDKEKFILSSTYDTDSLEYGMFLHSTKMIKHEFLQDRLLFKLNYFDSSILDSIMIFDTEEEAKLFAEIQ